MFSKKYFFLLKILNFGLLAHCAPSCIVKQCNGLLSERGGVIRVWYFTTTTRSSKHSSLPWCTRTEVRGVLYCQKPNAAKRKWTESCHVSKMGMGHLTFGQDQKIRLFKLPDISLISRESSKKYLWNVTKWAIHKKNRWPI